jgi:hypothetical protein
MSIQKMKRLEPYLRFEERVRHECSTSSLLAILAMANYIVERFTLKFKVNSSTETLSSVWHLEELVVVSLVRLGRNSQS